MTTKPNEPEGQMLVPAQPTDAMIDAALTTGARFGRAAMVNIWRSMLSAAPTHPVADAGGVTRENAAWAWIDQAFGEESESRKFDANDMANAFHAGAAQSVAAATAAKDAEIARLREALSEVDRHERSNFGGADGEKSRRASWRGVIRKVRAALSEAREAGE